MIFRARPMTSSEVYYYKEGNEYTTRTGGYAITYINNGTVTLVKDPASMTIIAYNTGEGSGSCCSLSQVDVTNINTLYLDTYFAAHRSGDYFKFGVATANTDNNFIVDTGTLTNEGSETNSVDVSAVTGQVYIKIRIYNVQYGVVDTEVTVFNIWGER